MKWAYDFHIHTAASPCGDELMTPHNIVHMSVLKGLDVIAITDHQTVANCEAVMKVGSAHGLMVIPGMEIECSEEFHLVALFPNLEAAYAMEKWLWHYLPPIENKISIFGNQQRFDEDDECIGEIKQLLLVAAMVSAEEIVKEARAHGAWIYPAHIDRKSYSILASLGEIPNEYQFNMVEISAAAPYSLYQECYKAYQVIQSSDAHYLEHISEREHYIEKNLLLRYGLIDESIGL